MAIAKYKTKSGLRWRAEIWDGNKRLASKAGFATKKEAARWERNKQQELEKLEEYYSHLMFSKMVSDYIVDCSSRFAKGTVSQKKTVFKTFAAFIKKDRPAEDVDVTLARKFIAYIARSISNVMANRYCRDLKACWNWHIKADALMHNPWAKVQEYPEDKKPKYIPPAADIDRVRVAAQGDQRDIIDCLYHTAARQCEILRMTWADVNMDRKTVRLWTRKRRGGGLEPDDLPMSETLYRLLERRWRNGGMNQTYVFTNPETGDRYRRQNAAIKYLFSDKIEWVEDEAGSKTCRVIRKGLCSIAGVKPFTAHSLRHHVASRLADTKKFTTRQLKNLLRHKSEKTTEIYLHELNVDRSISEELDLFSDVSTHGPTHEVNNGKKKTG